VALLALLRTQYPEGLDQKALQFSMDNLGYPMPDDRLLAHLAYLEEKGYVSVQKREGRGYSLMFAVLTARGWDLLDCGAGEAGVDGSL
jgi:hypothetical protein